MASLLELVESLVRDPAAKADYRADPDEFLDRHGFGGMEPADLEEALHHAADSFPPTLAAHLDPAAGFDALVPVDLQELGLDDELRPLEPLDDGPADLADGHGPSLADDVDLDAPPGLGGAAGGPDAPGETGGPDATDADPSFDRADDRGDLGHPGADDGNGDVDASPSHDDLAEDDDRAEDGGDGLGDDAPVDQPPAAAAWADDPFDRPGLGPDGDDPWFYNQDEPVFATPDDVDDDILDDVDEFHHDG